MLHPILELLHLFYYSMWQTVDQWLAIRTRQHVHCLFHCRWFRTFQCPPWQPNWLARPRQRLITMGTSQSWRTCYCVWNYNFRRQGKKMWNFFEQSNIKWSLSEQVIFVNSLKYIEKLSSRRHIYCKLWSQYLVQKSYNHIFLRLNIIGAFYLNNG